ncbi:unnamed protein product [Parnassius apollo]|uniref:(apollo) hypothetical protein n=1 Tax=Parnassius apollo TaxID=110799 RepID=A0A8S3XD08_PARAO|nr:unnamed protein product [Parnassius apollo]
MKDKDKVASLKLERELHLRKAEVFLKKCSSSEKEDKNVNKNKLSICFDIQKNLPLPVTNVTDEYYLRQLWLHNFGIHNLKENSATTYLFTENYAHKGPNEVITALDDYFLHHKIPDQTHLEIFCYNCFSQNKNRFIFTYFYQLCAKGLFETISVNYPIRGHSMMPIDRDFALIKRQKLKHKKIYEPDSYVNFVLNSRNAKKFEVVFLEKNLIERGQIDRSGEEREEQRGNERVLKVKNYETYYNDNIKQTIPGISGCRRVLFKRREMQSQPFSDSMTGDIFKDFSLYRVGISRYLRDVSVDCYQNAIKIKEAQINDIKKLIRFVPQEKRKFCETLIMEQAKLNESQIVEELDDEIE